MLRGDANPQTASREIATYWSVANQIRSKRVDLLETVDQYLIHSLTDDSGYIERQANYFLDDPLLKVDYKAQLDVQREKHQRDKPLPGIYEDLRAIEKEYSRNVAVAVADAALDVPYLIAPLKPQALGLDQSETDIEVRTVDEIDLEQRFQTAQNTLDRIDRGRLIGTTDEIVTNLKSEHELQSRERSRPLQELHLPLIDIPANETPEAGGVSTSTANLGLETRSTAKSRSSDLVFESLPGTSMNLASILQDAFTGTGALGGTLYRVGPRSHEWNWTTNPYLKTVTVNSPFAPEDVQVPYTEYWEQNYVADKLIAEMLPFSKYYKVGQKLYCPLCAYQPTQNCGGPEGCNCQAVIDAAKQHRHVFDQATASEMKRFRQ
jgi:hypothetical protein